MRNSNLISMAYIAFGCLLLSVTQNESANAQTTEPDRRTKDQIVSSTEMLRDLKESPKEELMLNWWTTNQGKIHLSSNRERPAILLVHGLNQTAEKSWIKPSKFEILGSGSAARDWRNHPSPSRKRIGKYHNVPNVGIYKLATSERIKDVDQRNWFDNLARYNFTVAAWSQPGKEIADAYPSMVQAYRNLEALTDGPIVLIGHSRGGLLIRKLLKEEKDMDRVRMVITLHSPHHGSEMANAIAELTADVTDLLQVGILDGIISAVDPEWNSKLEEYVAGQMSFLSDWILESNDRELDPDSNFFKSLGSGERALENVDYYTFGGTSPNYVRFYAWLFTRMSSVPQYSTDRGQYFVWRVEPYELTAISPFFDKVRDIARELKPGWGDGVVTDVSAHLPEETFPNARHFSNELNHSEVLYHAGVQMTVASLISELTAGGEVIHQEQIDEKRQAEEANQCCEIVHTDLQTGDITARDTTNGQTFTFRGSNQHLLDVLTPGTIFGPTSIEGFDVDPEGLQPAWVDTITAAIDVSPDRMNPHDGILDPTVVVRPDDWILGHGVIDTETVDLSGAVDSGNSNQPGLIDVSPDSMNKNDILDSTNGSETGGGSQSAILNPAMIARDKLRIATTHSGIRLTVASWTPEIEWGGYWGVVPTGESPTDEKPVHWAGSFSKNVFLLPAGTYDLYLKQDNNHVPIMLFNGIGIRNGELGEIAVNTGIRLNVASWVSEIRWGGYWGVVRAGDAPTNDKFIHWANSFSKDVLLLPPGTYDVYWKEDSEHEPMLSASGVVVAKGELVQVGRPAE